MALLGIAGSAIFMGGTVACIKNPEKVMRWDGTSMPIPVRKVDRTRFADPEMGIALTNMVRSDVSNFERAGGGKWFLTQLKK